MGRATEWFRGTNTVPGGCLKICEAEGAEFVPLFHTLLGALGPTADAAVAHYTGEIVEGLGRSGPLDGVILFLHGACWAAGYPDVERHVIDAVRAAFWRCRSRSRSTITAISIARRCAASISPSPIAILRISTWAKPASGRRGR